MPREASGDKLPGMAALALQCLDKFFRIDSGLSQKTRKCSHSDFTVIGHDTAIGSFAHHHMTSALTDGGKSKFL